MLRTLRSLYRYLYVSYAYRDVLHGPPLSGIFSNFLEAWPLEFYVESAFAKIWLSSLRKKILRSLIDGSSSAEVVLDVWSKVLQSPVQLRPFFSAWMPVIETNRILAYQAELIAILDRLGEHSIAESIELISAD